MEALRLAEISQGEAQVRNADLWQRLDELLQTHTVTAQWVRGHVGHPENERCDQLATAAAAKVAATPAPPIPICADIADVGLFANAAPAEEDDE